MDNRSDQKKLSVNDAAKRVRRNPETVRRWIWSGKLPAEKLGNQLYIKANDFETYCRESGTKQYHTHNGVLPQSSDGPRKEPVGLAGEDIDDLFERIRNLRERIRARMGRDFTEEETVGSIRELREGRDRDIFGVR